MKKDRNCGGGMPYPIYPAYPGVMPIQNMPMNNMMPNMFNTTPNYTPDMNNMSGIIEQQLSNLTNQVNSLERRIMSLESLVGSPNSKYNNSNYQVM
ncbi:MAG: hypothetical protein E7173_00745 [Firmicutes bacterium]|nr:hypothetical protein [Bacillota bacterium]